MATIRLQDVNKTYPASLVGKRLDTKNSRGWADRMTVEGPERTIASDIHAKGRATRVVVPTGSLFFFDTASGACLGGYRATRQLPCTH